MLICMLLGKLMSYTYEEIQSHFISSFLFVEEKLRQYRGSDKFCVPKVHPSSDVHRGYVCSQCRMDERAVLEA